MLVDQRVYPFISNNCDLSKSYQWLTSLIHWFIDSCFQPWKLEGQAVAPRSAARSLEGPAVEVMCNGWGMATTQGCRVPIDPMELVSLISLGRKIKLFWSSLEIWYTVYSKYKQKLVQLHETPWNITRSTPVGLPMAAPWSNRGGRKLLLPLPMYQGTEWANP